MTTPKFNFHTVCLVCFKELPHPDNRGTEGEHPIPKNIGGFWKSYDVCEECIKYFGDNIDHLALSNPHLVNAWDSIHKGEKLKFQPKLKYKSIDKYTGKQFKMFRRGNEYKINVQKSNNSIICPDVDAPIVGLNWLKERLIGIFTEVEIEKEYQDLLDKSKTLKSNESIYSEKLSIRLYKGVNTKLEFDENTCKSLTPLIAKIAVIFLGYILSFEDLKKISNFNSLRDHARFNKPLLEHEIIFRPIFSGYRCEKFHKIVFRNFDDVGIIEVTLLRYPNWTVMLNYNERIELRDENGKIFEEFGLVFDFENVNKKFIVYRYKNEDKDYSEEII